MSCLPEMPCYGGGNISPTGTNCGADPCDNKLKTSDLIKYIGPNLPCTGIETCDDLTTILQKLELAICQFTTTTTSTSTSTSSSTTTTTTTACPCKKIELSISQLDLNDATGNSSPGNNNSIVLTFRNCNNLFSSYPTSTPGVQTPPGLCTTSQGQIIALTYYKNNSPIVSTRSTATVTNTCC